MMPVRRAQNDGRDVRQEPALRDTTLGHEPTGSEDWRRAMGQGQSYHHGDYGGRFGKAEWTGLG